MKPAEVLDLFSEYQSDLPVMTTLSWMVHCAVAYAVVMFDQMMMLSNT